MKSKEKEKKKEKLKEHNEIDHPDDIVIGDDLDGEDILDKKKNKSGSCED